MKKVSSFEIFKQGAFDKDNLTFSLTASAAISAIFGTVSAFSAAPILAISASIAIPFAVTLTSLSLIAGGLNVSSNKIYQQSQVSKEELKDRIKAENKAALEVNPLAFFKSLQSDFNNTKVESEPVEKLLSIKKQPKLKI